MSAAREARWTARFWPGFVRLLRFDLRRFRVIAAVVVGLELLRAALVEWVAHLAPLEMAGFFAANGGTFDFEVLDGALWLTAAITTAILVQADHPTEDRAFWRSRPIAAGQLASAKLVLLVALFVALPLLLNTARLLTYGAPLGSVAASAVQLLVIGGSSVVPAWALAVATRTLPRFLAAAAGLVVVWWFTVLMAITFVPSYILGPRFFGGGFRTAGRGFAPVLADWQGVDRHGWLAALAVTMVATALLVAFYRTRRAAPALVAAIAAVAMTAVVPHRDRVVPAEPDLAAIARGPLPLVGNLGLPTKSVIDAETPRPGRLPLRGQLPMLPWSALPVNVSATLTFDDARLTTRDATWKVSAQSYCCDNAEMRALTAAAGGREPWLDTAEVPASLRIAVFAVPTDDGERLRGRAIDVDAPVRIQFTRHRLVGELPLRAGAAFRTEAYLLEILAIEPRARVAFCRFARFPSLASIPGPPLRFFVGSGMPRVVPAMSYWRQESETEGGEIGWARGRSWVARVALPLGVPWADERGRVAPLPTRLYIIESRPAGELRTSVVGHDVPVVDTTDPLETSRRY